MSSLEKAPDTRASLGELLMSPWIQKGIEAESKMSLAMWVRSTLPDFDEAGGSEGEEEFETVTKVAVGL